MKHNKIIIIGDSSVGKTSMIRSWVKGKFPEKTSPTIGSAFSEVMYEFHGKQYKIQLWDTAGEENYKSMIPIYSRGANGVIIVFEVGKKQSFEALDEWYLMIESIPDIKKCFVGNKIDIPNREVTTEQGMEYAEKKGGKYFETSALSGEGLDKMFNGIILEVLKEKEDQIVVNTEEGLSLEKEEVKTEEPSGCC